MKLFHIHKWSKWEKINVCSTPPLSMQERYCKTCGRIKRDWLYTG